MWTHSGPDWWQKSWKLGACKHMLTCKANLEGEEMWTRHINHVQLHSWSGYQQSLKVWVAQFTISIYRFHAIPTKKTGHLTTRRSSGPKICENLYFFPGAALTSSLFGIYHSGCLSSLLFVKKTGIECMFSWSLGIFDPPTGLIFRSIEARLGGWNNTSSTSQSSSVDLS